MSKNTFGPHGWAFEEESIDRLPSGAFSAGVGPDIVLQSGHSKESIVSGLRPIFDQLADGHAGVGFVDQTRCYYWRRGKAIDLGTRSDFEEIGWSAICDACDASLM
jgi:hypothetical protein